MVGMVECQMCDGMNVGMNDGWNDGMCDCKNVGRKRNE